MTSFLSGSTQHRCFHLPLMLNPFRYFQKKYPYQPSRFLCSGDVARFT